MPRAIALAVLAAILLALLAWSQRRPAPEFVSGYVEADEIRLGSRVGGRVARVLVVEGQRVAQGDVLVELEPYDLVERLAEAKAVAESRAAERRKLEAGLRPQETSQAQARRDQLKARLDLLRAGARPEEKGAARAELDLGKAELELAQQNHTRVEGLPRNVVSSQERDRAASELKAARAKVAARQAALDQVESGSRVEEVAAAAAALEEAEQALALARAGYRAEDVEQARSAEAAARAAVAVVEKALGELSVRAPVAGLVEAIELQPGDLVAANAPVVAMADASRLWVRCYVPEARLDIAVGQAASVRVDALPDRRFPAKIAFVARQGEFTPSNAQTPEERAKQVFRVKVTLDPGAESSVRPGMSADVWIQR